MFLPQDVVDRFPRGRIGDVVKSQNTRTLRFRQAADGGVDVAAEYVSAEVSVGMTPLGACAGDPSWPEMSLDTPGVKE